MTGKFGRVDPYERVDSIGAAVLALKGKPDGEIVYLFDRGPVGAITKEIQAAMAKAGVGDVEIITGNYAKAPRAVYETKYTIRKGPKKLEKRDPGPRLELKL